MSTLIWGLDQLGRGGPLRKGRKKEGREGRLLHANTWTRASGTVPEPRRRGKGFGFLQERGLDSAPALGGEPAEGPVVWQAAFPTPLGLGLCKGVVYPPPPPRSPSLFVQPGTSL